MDELGSSVFMAKRIPELKGVEPAVAGHPIHSGCIHFGQLDFQCSNPKRKKNPQEY